LNGLDSNGLGRSPFKLLFRLAWPKNDQFSRRLLAKNEITKKIVLPPHWSKDLEILSKAHLDAWTQFKTENQVFGGFTRNFHFL
jgi:hypothetical protein